ncbi:MAG TPA: ExeM/NucH family extracellular endonuclease [Pyrinomonadaceae bacterium]
MRRQFIALFIFFALIAAALLQRSGSVIPASQALSSNIVISQVYGGGGNTGANYTHDFIELFNRGNTTIDISAWSVQYASAGGNSWAVTNLCTSTTANTCTIAPGKYYLVQQAAGGGGTTPLPTPINATGTSSMSATNGKVALVNNRTALTVTCPTSNASVIDFVGFGGSTTTTGFCWEGAGPTPPPSNTTAVLRAVNGCTETDNNNTDFATGAPNPRNSATTANVCGGGGGDAAPTVTGNTPANGANSIAVDTNVTVTFSENVTVSNSSFTISCNQSGAHTYALSGSGSSYTLNPDVNFANGETCTVTVIANQVFDTDTNDPPDNMAANYVFSFTTIPSAGECGDAYTPIFEIQGSSTASPKANQTVVTEGVVTADFQLTTQQSGFYIQDPGGDANTATSDGVFVFATTSVRDVSVGDRVRVLGQVVEFNTMTELTNTTIKPCNSGNSISPTSVDLPEPVLNDLERYEGMLVNFPEALTVTGNNLQGRFGEVMLSSDGRLFQQNSFDRPNSPGALARAESNARRQIMLDDAQSIQNPNPIPYIGADNTLRAGDTVTNLTGVIDYGLTTTNSTTRDYRVQPTITPSFARTNPRPAAPPAVGGTLRAASSNVLNYFNGNGTGGGFPTSRGASSQAEFTRQRDKIISAIKTLNPDVLGVIEIENDGFNNPNGALQDLVNGLNDATAPGTYAGIDSPNPGTDEIKNAIIYKPSAVTPVGSQANDVNPVWDQARPPLAQTFQQNSNGEKFTFIVTHFTSKGCSSSDTGDDADKGDGQGCDNGQRKAQAERLLVFIQDRKTTAGDPDVLSMGDYNAYGEEDPMFIMEQDASDTLADGAGGLVSESKRFVPANERYSYQFDAQFGELDHALATKSLDNQVNGAGIWHINADEPSVIDYNTEFKTQDLYTPTPYRSSDHDPLLVGLNLSPTVLPGQVVISEFRWSGPAGANDEFIELFNKSYSDITVEAGDGSSGWAVAADDATGIRYVIPNGTVLPARSHFLIVNNNQSGGYSLSAYPAGNNGQSPTTATPDTTSTGAATYTADIPVNTGIALFNTSVSQRFSTGFGGTRIDAVGVNGAASGGVDPCNGSSPVATSSALYREGVGIYPYGQRSPELEYTFIRNLTSGIPQDTNDNVSDFMFLDTSIQIGSCVHPTKKLGAPGPQNRTSPLVRTGVIPGFSIDGTKNSTLAPNRVRARGSYLDTLTPSRPNDATPDYPLGTLSVRRRYTNATGQPVTRLRFRLVNVTTFPAPVGIADLRGLTSPTISVTTEDPNVCSTDPTATSTTPPCDVTVRGLTLENAPSQPYGGGLNSTLSAGTIDLANPLPHGSTINVHFLLGAAQNGTFQFFITVEALP